MELSDLFQVIDQYDEQAFIECSDALYEAMGFAVLRKDDIRRIDLKEKLATFFRYNETCVKAGGHFDKPLASYVHKAVAEHFIFGSERTEKYNSLLETTISSVNSGSADLSTIENLVLIFISDFSVYRSYFQGKKRESKLQLLNVPYYLKRDAIEVAKYIFNEISICGRHTQRAGLRKASVVERFQDHERVFAYVITVLFVLRILQFEGEI